MQLLTIDELRQRISEQKKEDDNKPMQLDDVLSPETIESRNMLVDMLQMLPGFTDEEKEVIIDAFKSAFIQCAEDCISFGIDAVKKGLIKK